MARIFSTFQWLREEFQALLEATRHPEKGLSKLQRFAHFWVLSWKSFSGNRGPARAAALAYATLLALIPMLAVVMSVSSSFLKQEGEERIDQFIAKFVTSIALSAPKAAQAHQEPASEGNVSEQSSSEQGKGEESQKAPSGSDQPAGNYAKSDEVVKARHALAWNIAQFIQNTRSRTLGVTGSVLLIFAAISMLSQIEDTFNDLWGVARGRSWFMRIVLYWGVLSLAPLLVITAVGLATGPHLESTKKFLMLTPFIGNLTFRFLPVALLCLTFGVFYMLMPNTKVHFRAAMIGGLISGLLFHLNNVVSMLYVSRVVSNSRIYGSLGLVPVFMVGLYFAWWILLFGGQVAYAFQNRTSYIEEKQVESINQRGREFIALRLVTCVGQRFVRGEPPPGVAEISKALCVPSRLIQQIMETLAEARVVIETAGEAAYVPARPLESITCHDILMALRANHGQELAARDEPSRSEVYGEFQRIQEAEREVASSVTLEALVNRTEAKGEKLLAEGDARSA
jgi:membrane protein